MSAPRIPYWHVWTDAGGISRQTRCWLEKFDLQSIGGGAAPQFQGTRHTGPTTTLITVLPPGWIGDWHENPRPQWIIPLSGAWFTETMDGTRAEMGPGEISFGEDQGTKGGRGHRSGTLGAEPAVLMLVQYEEPPNPNCPCRFT